MVWQSLPSIGAAAGEITLGLIEGDMRPVFARGKAVSFWELQQMMRSQGKDTSATRVSLGLATTFADVYYFMRFAAGLRDRTIADLGAPRALPDGYLGTPDTA